MKRYIGTKIIHAEPQVEHHAGEPREGYKVVYADGYTSWSPKDVFEEAYRPANGLTFGLAIEALKQGLQVARAGWNGKGMWLVLVPGTPTAQLKPGTPYSNALGMDSCEILPHIDMWTVNASGRRAMLPGWVASQTDMLAEDWMVVEAVADDNDFALGQACDLSGEGTCEACQ